MFEWTATRSPSAMTRCSCPEILAVMDVEEVTLRAFIRRERAERYVALLKTRTRRKKLIAEFDHLYDLDGRYIRPVEKKDQSPGRVYELLRQRGAPQRCYVMSASSELDGQETDLRAALEETVCYGTGTLISCVPGKLGYYEGEDMEARYILERPES